MFPSLRLFLNALRFTENFYCSSVLNFFPQLVFGTFKWSHIWRRDIATSCEILLERHVAIDFNRDAFRNMIRFYGEELLAPRPTPKLEDHPLCAIRDYLFNIFAATLHTGGRSTIRNLRTCRAVVTGTHLSRLAITQCRIFCLKKLLDIQGVSRL